MNRFKVIAGDDIPIGSEYTFNGIRYPYNWIENLSDQELFSIRLARVAPVETPVEIPKVTRYQARLQLYRAGLLQQVETLVNHPETSIEIKIAWEDAREWEKNSPFIIALSAALNLTSAQVDNLFIEASKIN